MSGRLTMSDRRRLASVRRIAPTRSTSSAVASIRRASVVQRAGGATVVARMRSGCRRPSARRRAGSVPSIVLSSAPNASPSSKAMAGSSSALDRRRSSTSLPLRPTAAADEPSIRSDNSWTVRSISATRAVVGPRILPWVIECGLDLVEERIEDRQTQHTQYDARRMVELSTSVGQAGDERRRRNVHERSVAATRPVDVFACGQRAETDSRVERPRCGHDVAVLADGRQLASAGHTRFRAWHIRPILSTTEPTGVYCLKPSPGATSTTTTARMVSESERPPRPSPHVAWLPPHFGTLVHLAWSGTGGEPRGEQAASPGWAAPESHQMGLASTAWTGYLDDRSNGPMGSTPDSPATRLRCSEALDRGAECISVASVAADPLWLTVFCPAKPVHSSGFLSGS